MLSFVKKMRRSLFHFVHLLFILFSAFLLVSDARNIVGLKNLGETCYANAVFQLLYRNPDFRTSLDNYLRTNQNANTNLQALQELFNKMENAPAGSTVTPATFKVLPEAFERDIQYDVSQVLTKYQEIRNFDWSPFAIGLKSARIFTVKLDLELLLNVPESEKLSLQSLLALHFRNYKIQSVSKNLIVRIKRLHKVHGEDQKIIDKISIPEHISLQQFFSPEATNSAVNYELDSFIEHCGHCSDGGHYLFYFHDKRTGDYYAINDEKVRIIAQNQFFEHAARAYLFLYRQIENK